MATNLSKERLPKGRPVVLVKLGGSLLTNKKGQAEARPEVIDRLAEEVADALPEMTEALVLGHGSGSFGHVAATQHGLRSGAGDKPSALGAAKVQRVATSLHLMVLDSLLNNDVPAWSWSPSSALESRGGFLVEGEVGALATALKAGLLPVLYGDAIADHSQCASIASTEAVVRHVVPRLRPRGWRVRRLLWLGETDGIYDAAGETVEHVDGSNLQQVRSAVGGASGTDVTGGMLLRLETAWQLARQGIESQIVDGRRPGALSSGLRGESLPGTRVVPS